MFKEIGLFITPSPIISKSHKFDLTVFLLNSIKLSKFKYKSKMICEENRMNKESRFLSRPYFCIDFTSIWLNTAVSWLRANRLFVCFSVAGPKISSLQLSKWIPTVPSFFVSLGIPTISGYFEERTTFRELYSCSDRLLLEEVYCLKVERFFWLR